MKNNSSKKIVQQTIDGSQKNLIPTKSVRESSTSNLKTVKSSLNNPIPGGGFGTMGSSKPKKNPIVSTSKGLIAVNPTQPVAADKDLEKSAVVNSGLYYFDQTVAGINLVEVLEHKRSENVGKSNSRLIFWKKSKSLVLEEGQLFKVTLKDFRRIRFGVDLTRVNLDSLKDFECIIVHSRI
jgi:hypothetical protein